MNRLHELRPSSDEAIDLAGALTLTALAAYSFQSSYGAMRYLIVSLVMAAIAVALTHVLISRSVHTLVIVAVLGVSYLVIGGALALPSQAFAGVLPTPATVVGALRGAVAGWKELLTTVPPVGDVGDLMVLPAFVGTFGAGLSVLGARRLTALWPALVPPTVVLVLGILCGVDSPVSVVAHGAVFAAVVLIWLALRYRRTRQLAQQSVGGRRRRMLGAAGLVGVSAAVGFVAGPGLPLAQAHDRVILRDTIDPPFDPFDYPSPLAGYRTFIKPLKDETLFTIEGLPEGVPIRLATMDDYDGIVWRVTGGKLARAGASGYFERVGTNVDPEYDGERATIRVTIGNWDEVWLPTVGEVVSLRFEGPRARELNSTFRYNRASDTGAMQRRLLQPGDSYVMQVVLPTNPTTVDSAEVASSDRNAANDTVPEDVATWAAPIVDGLSDPFERVIALTDELRLGFYSSGDVGQQDALGGHSEARLVQFTDQENQMIGNAEQYGASLGLMLRSLGIPSRVSIGFIPGASDGSEWSDGPIQVTGVAAEAWAEIPLEGIGWVWFNATPLRDRTQPPAEPQARPLPERNTQIPPPPPVLVEDPRSEPSKETERQKEAEEAELPIDDANSGVPSSLIWGAAIAGPPVLLLGGAAATILAVKSRRRRRRRSRGEPHMRIANGFSEMVDVARDFGRPIPRSATRRELAGFTGAASGTTLAHRADAAVFSPDVLTDEEVASYWADVATAVGSLRKEMGFVERIRSRLSLTSLRKVNES